MNKQDRAEEMQDIAYRLKMDYNETDEWGLERLLSDFRLFGRGFKRRFHHVLRREDPLMESDLRIFDYHYYTSNGKSRRHHNQTVFFLQSRNLALPEFWLHPETIFNKIGAMLWQKDIDFFRYPDFSNNYVLGGDDEVFIRDQFNDSVLQFFTIEKGWSLEGVGYYMIFYRKRKILNPRQIVDLYQKGEKIYKMLKYDGPAIQK